MNEAVERKARELLAEAAGCPITLINQAVGTVPTAVALRAIARALEGDKDSSHIHSCSLYCDRPDCIKEQRDQMRGRMEGEAGEDAVERVAEAIHEADEEGSCYSWSGTKAFDPDRAELLRAMARAAIAAMGRGDGPNL